MTVDNIELTPHFQQFITRLVESGEYHDANEVLEDGLRLLEESRIDEAAYEAEAADALLRYVREHNSRVDASQRLPEGVPLSPEQHRLLFNSLVEEGIRSIERGEGLEFSTREELRKLIRGEVPSHATSSKKA